jgi:hypothetical protein
MLTVCGDEGGVIVLPLEPPPPPHADMIAAVRLSAVIRDAFETMIDSSSKFNQVSFLFERIECVTDASPTAHGVPR